MNRKRERGRNYTEYEKENLLEILKKFLHIVENKKTDMCSVTQKNAAWDTISAEHNISAQTGPRTGMQLKLLFDAIKKKAKKDMAEEKVEIYKTGGGTSNKLDPITNKFVELMDPKREMITSDDSTDPLGRWYTGIVNSDDNTDLDAQISQGDLENFDTKDFETEVIDEPNENTTSQVDIPQSRISSPKMLKKKSKLHELRHKYRTEEDEIKLEMLKIRKEKEQVELDILKLTRKEKEIDLEIKEYNYKKLLLQENY